ncbi:M24B family metallopeptidase, partial [Clostridium sp.]|uniref:M24B family metallopeptidase n=1 Tax=Clostridium sp. TaxID=1506 RepID=UPI003F36DFA6
MCLVNELRRVMKENNIDHYIIPSSDPHQSEYVADFYKGRSYVSGFTGSAGVLVVSLNSANLWTDGRYFIQAENQLKNRNIDLMKMRTPGYPTVEEWIEENVKENEVVGFDGCVYSVNQFKELEKISKVKNIKIKMDKDLLDEVWGDRPNLPTEKIFIHEVEFAGKSAKEKLSCVRAEMDKLSVDSYIISSLDDIAWLFNIRGNDINFNPVVMSYALIKKDSSVLYINLDKVDKNIEEYLINEGVILKDYDELYNDVKEIKGSLLIDPSKVNAKIYVNVSEDVKVIEDLNITTKLKAIKNDVEIANLKNCQVRDGVAMVKFIKWLKESVKSGEVTEISASERLSQFRAEGDNFKGESFGTIAGYKDHAAMMHYSATKETQYVLKEEGMFLVDSGGQYLDGTTDITRTFILGNITEEEKRDFTLVLKGHINLLTAKFLKGTPGKNLDILARRPLWDYGLDYKCGTGHGVGFFL